MVDDRDVSPFVDMEGEPTASGTGGEETQGVVIVVSGMSRV
jgi:hypothetical protein